MTGGGGAGGREGGGSGWSVGAGLEVAAHRPLVCFDGECDRVLVC